MAHLPISSAFTPPSLIPEPPTTPSELEPAPIAIHRLDFSALGLPEYENRYALVIDNLFSLEDCQKLLSAAEASGDWEAAQITAPGNNSITNTSYRNSSRIMLDDHDLAGWILERIRPYLADIERLAHGSHHTQDRKLKGPPVRLSRLNERLRFLKYGPGQFFKPHRDGVYLSPDGSEASYYTLQIYLNGSSEALQGGATRFLAAGSRGKKTNGLNTPFVDVQARLGRVLVFEQEALLHSGEPVSEGIKISLRTDFMYVVDGDVTTVDVAR